MFFKFPEECALHHVSRSRTPHGRTRSRSSVFYRIRDLGEASSTLNYTLFMIRKPATPRHRFEGVLSLTCLQLCVRALY